MQKSAFELLSALTLKKKCYFRLVYVLINNIGQFTFSIRVRRSNIVVINGNL
jgi:hypothetical protein